MSFRKLATGLAITMLAAGPALSADTAELSNIFGQRQAILDASISPSRSARLYVQMSTVADNGPGRLITRGRSAKHVRAFPATLGVKVEAAFSY